MFNTFVEKFQPEKFKYKFRNAHVDNGESKLKEFNLSNNLFENLKTTTVTKPINCEPSAFLQPQSHTQKMHCLWKNSGSLPASPILSSTGFCSIIMKNNFLQKIGLPPMFTDFCSHSAPSALGQKNQCKTGIPSESINKTITDSLNICPLAFGFQSNSEDMTKAAVTVPESTQTITESLPACPLSQEQKTIDCKPSACANALIASIIGYNDQLEDETEYDSDWSDWDEYYSTSSIESESKDKDTISVTSDYSTESDIPSCDNNQILKEKSEIVGEHNLQFGDCNISFEKPKCTNSYVSYILNWSDAEEDLHFDNDPVPVCDPGNKTDDPEVLWEEFQNTCDPYALIGGTAMSASNTTNNLTLCNNNESKKKVRFNLKPEIHHMYAWNFAYRNARKCFWETCARDRQRFKNRVCLLEDKFSKIFTSEHRNYIYNKLFCKQV